MGTLDGQNTSSVAGQAVAGQMQAGQPSASAGLAAGMTAPDAAPAVTSDSSPAVDATTAAALVVLVYGPPLAGTSTQAQLLSSRYGLPVVSVDSLLHEAYALQQTEAVAMAAAAAAAAGGGPPSPGRTQRHNLLEQLSKLLFPSTNPGESPAGPSIRASSAASTQSASAGAHHELQHQQLPVPELVTAALQAALHQEHYSRGYIFDGLNSKYLSSSAVVARCLLQGVGLVCKALQQAEGAVPTPPAVAAAVAKGVKAASRPTRSRPGGKAAAAAPEPVPPIMTFIKPDVWEGSQQVGCAATAAELTWQ